MLWFLYTITIINRTLTRSGINYEWYELPSNKIISPEIVLSYSILDYHWQVPGIQSDDHTLDLGLVMSLLIINYIQTAKPNHNYVESVRNQTGTGQTDIIPRYNEVHKQLRTII